MSTITIVVIVFIFLIITLAAGLPVAFSLGLSSIVGTLLMGEPGKYQVLATLFSTYGSSWSITCLPLFILMAEILSFTGMANGLFTLMHRWLRVPGALPVATVASCGVFAAMSGSSTAGAATMGLVAIPEMLKRKVSKSLAAGVCAAGGTLNILIPPSAILIIYGVLTEESIGELFIAGIIPGIIMIFLFGAYIIGRAIKNPSWAPIGKTASWSERLRSLREVVAPILIILAVLGGIYSGICTATEAAGVGAFLALISAAIYRRFTWAYLKPALMNTVRVSCFVIFIITGAMIFGFLLTYLGVPQAVTEFVAGLKVHPYAIIGLINIFLILLGCFLDPASILVLTVPILLPVIKFLGFDPIWFGIMATLNMEIANITPPIGLNLYVIKTIAPPEITLADIISGVMPFFVLLIIGIALIIFFPQVVLWLPATM